MDLPQYKFNPETGEWRQRNHQVFKDRKWLGFVTYKSGEMQWKDPPCPEKGPLPSSYQECLLMAAEIFKETDKVRIKLGDQTLLFDDAAKQLRWFLLPSESYYTLKYSKVQQNLVNVPFTPTVYPRKKIQIETETKTMDYSANYAPNFRPERDSSAETTRGLFRGNMVSYLESGFESDANQADAESDSVVLRTKEAINENKNDVTKSDQEVKQTEHTSQGKDNSQHKRSHDNSISTCDGSAPKVVKLSGGQKNIEGHLNSSVGNVSDGKDQMAGPSSKNTLLCDGIACFTKRKTEAANALPQVKYKWHSPPKHIFKPTTQALEEFDMIRNGDRVLVCLSGGKDSLSLLHTMHQLQFYAKKKGINFQLGAVTVDPQTSAYDPSPLKGYLKQLDVPYFYEEQSILDAASNLSYEVASICSFCSRLKRGRIYHTARRETYNVLALGQHLDDLAESFLMSVFHNGILRTMKASYTVQEGDLRVIRPFVYVREKHLRQFAEEKKMPVIPENCPACFEAPKERHRIKQLLATQEVLHPRLFPSILAAIKPIMAINKTGVSAKMILAQLTVGDDEEDE